jgi:hypothetical protein
MNGHGHLRAIGTNGQHSGVVTLIGVKKIHEHCINFGLFAAFLSLGVSLQSDVFTRAHIYSQNFNQFLSCPRIRDILL